MINNNLFFYLKIRINNKKHSNSRRKISPCLSPKTGEASPQNHTSCFLKRGGSLSHKTGEEAFVLRIFSKINKFKVGQRCLSFSQDHVTRFAVVGAVLLEFSPPQDALLLHLHIELV